MAATHDNIVWGYDPPLTEAEEIAGLVSFYNEKVDIFVDEDPKLLDSVVALILHSVFDKYGRSVYNDRS